VFHFGARFVLKFESNTCKLCQNISLSDLPKERVFGELKKLFNAQNSHYGLFLIIQTNIDKKVFGFEIKKREFIKASKIYLRYRSNLPKTLYRFFFPCRIKISKRV